MMLSRTISVFLLAAALAGCDGANKADDKAGLTEAPDYEPDARRVALTEPPEAVIEAVHDMNARRGRILFVAKSCVICHEVNGIGGRAAPSLNAEAEADMVDPLDFASRMWRGARAMAALQEAELGYQIEMDAQDIADLAAFAGSPEEQALLASSDLPEGLETWFLNAPVITDDEWLDYRSRGDRLPETPPFDQP